MGKLYQCDKCEKIDKSGMIGLRMWSKTTDEEIDLCPQCYDKLMKWLDVVE